MSFNYDFHPYLMRPRRLREASSEDSSFLSTTLSSLSSRGSTVSCMSGPMSDFFRDHAKEERYVQPGLRDIRVGFHFIRLKKIAFRLWRSISWKNSKSRRRLSTPGSLAMFPRRRKNSRLRRSEPVITLLVVFFTMFQLPNKDLPPYKTCQLVYKLRRVITFYLRPFSIKSRLGQTLLAPNRR